MEILYDAWDKMKELAPAINGYLLIAVPAILLGMVISACMFALYDPRREERAMARKAERSKIAGILNGALSYELERGAITAAQYDTWTRRIGAACNLPDMKTRKRSEVRPWKLIGTVDGKLKKIPDFDLREVKKSVKARLSAMGVNIKSKLQRRDKYQTFMDKAKKLKKA